LRQCQPQRMLNPCLAWCAESVHANNSRHRPKCVKLHVKKYVKRMTRFHILFHLSFTCLSQSIISHACEIMMWNTSEKVWKSYETCEISLLFTHFHMVFTFASGSASCYKSSSFWTKLIVTHWKFLYIHCSTSCRHNYFNQQSSACFVCLPIKHLNACGMFVAEQLLFTCTYERKKTVMLKIKGIVLCFQATVQCFPDAILIYPTMYIP